MNPESNSARHHTQIDGKSGSICIYSNRPSVRWRPEDVYQGDLQLVAVVD